MSRLASTVGTKIFLSFTAWKRSCFCSSRALRQKLPHAPKSVQAEAKVRMVVNHLHRFVQGAALRFRHLGLVIGVTHIEVSVGHEEEIPLLGGIERHGEAPRDGPPRLTATSPLVPAGNSGTANSTICSPKSQPRIELGGVFRLAQRQDGLPCPAKGNCDERRHPPTPSACFPSACRKSWAQPAPRVPRVRTSLPRLDRVPGRRNRGRGRSSRRAQWDRHSPSTPVRLSPAAGNSWAARP